jgi:hypothetical protein
MDQLTSMRKLAATAPVLVIRRGDGPEAVADFLSGRTAGRTLLRALFDHVLNEPVPQRLTELLRRHERTRDGSRSAPRD